MSTSDIGIRATILGLAEFRRGTNDMRNQLNQIGAAASGASSGASSFGRSLTSLGSDISRIGQTMTYGLTLPIITLGGSLVATGIQFEDAFAGVSKTVDGVSDDFGNLTKDGQIIQDQFRQLALEIPISVNELSRIGELGGQLGITKTELTGFVETVALLGVTTEMTSESAATFFARLGNIMGVSADQMAEFTKQAGSTVVDLGNKFAATEPEIAALSLRLAGAGQVAGLSTPQILALSTAMASLGIQSEMGGSALSRILLELKRATDDYTATGGEASAQLELFAQAANLTVDAFTQLEKTDPLTALLKVIGGFNQMQESGTLTNDMLKVMNFDTIRLQDVLNRLGPNIGLVNQALQVANDEWATQDALQIEAQKRFNTTKSQIQLLKNAFVDLGIEIFYLYKDNINGLIKSFSNLIKMFRETDDGTLKLVIKIGLLVAAIGPLLIVLGTVLQLFGTFVTYAATATPIIALLAGSFGALALAWKGNVFGIRTTTKKVVNALQDVVHWLNQAYTSGKNIWRGNVFSGLANVFEALTKSVHGFNVFSYVFRSFGMGDQEAKKLGNTIQTMLLPYLTNLSRGFSEVARYWEMFKSALQTGGLESALKALFTPTLGGGLTPIESIIHAFGVGQGTVDRFNAVLSYFTDTLIPKLMPILGSLTDLFLTFVKVVQENVIPTIIKVGEYIAINLVPPLLDVVNRIVEVVESIIKYVGPSFIATLGIAFIGFASLLKFLVIPAIDWLLDRVQDLVKNFGPLIGIFAGVGVALFLLWPILGLINTAIGLVTAAAWALTTPLGLLLLPLALGIGVIWAYTNNVYGFKDAIDSIGDPIRNFIDSIVDLYQAFKDLEAVKFFSDAVLNYIFGSPDKPPEISGTLGLPIVTVPPGATLGAIDMDTGEPVGPVQARPVGQQDYGGKGRKNKLYSIGIKAQPELFMPDTNGTFMPYRDLVSLFENGTTSYVDNSVNTTNNVFSPQVSSDTKEDAESTVDTLYRQYRMAALHA